jgi:Asp-tRNA(Asn)/Glu-tRNA(Gln) amidotransferase A subunit family amidase
VTNLLTASAEPRARTVCSDVSADRITELLPASAVVERALAAAVDSRLGALWVVDGDGARRAALRIDERRAEGRPTGSLAGVPLVVKDCFDVAGLPTSGGVTGEHAPARSDAEAVRRLRAAGAVPLGKAAMDQLGWSLGGIAPGFPVCRNPVDPGLSPGGSSSGSAVAVAGGIAALGLGTDTAGSIRVPAAFCGVVGLKPPAGAIPLDGALAFVPSFDLAGVIAGTVSACVAAYGVLAATRPPDVAAPGRIGLLEDALERADPDVSAIVEHGASRLEQGGLHVEPARLDWTPAGFGRVLAAELARTWGAEVSRAPDRFTDDVQRSVAYGNEVGDAELEGLRRDLARSAREVEGRLAAWDVLIGPTVPVPVPSVDRPLTVAELTQGTRPFSALGWPAFSVPGGEDRRGRPVGIQVASSPRRFGDLIAVAAALEA